MDSGLSSSSGLRSPTGSAPQPLTRINAMRRVQPPSSSLSSSEGHPRHEGSEVSDSTDDTPSTHPQGEGYANHPSRHPETNDGVDREGHRGSGQASTNETQDGPQRLSLSQNQPGARHGAPAGLALPSPASHERFSHPTSEEASARAAENARVPSPTVAGRHPDRASSPQRAFSHEVALAGEASPTRAVVPVAPAAVAPAGSSAVDDGRGIEERTYRQQALGLTMDTDAFTPLMAGARGEATVASTRAVPQEMRGAADATAPGSSVGGAPMRASGAAAGLPAGLLRGARVATAEERSVRFLFHNRQRRVLRERPPVVSNVVLDRQDWEQPLCYAPFFVPCLRNAFYSVPLSAVVRTVWESEVSNPLSPSVAYSTSLNGSGARADPQQATLSAAAPPRRSPSIDSHTLLSHPAIYHVPSPSIPRALRTGEARGTDAAPDAAATAVVNPFYNAGPLTTASEGRLLAAAAAQPTSSFTQNCCHLLSRCFCVRCAVASQAVALQADMKMRGAAPNVFPWCACMGVETRSSSDLLCMICLLDALSLGIPCGCCCYHGVGTALYGWHLRYLLRARYRIFAWTAVDLLILCCIPGLAVDQQGAELLLNGVPESSIGLHFMS